MILTIKSKVMKKFFIPLLALVFPATMFVSCDKTDSDGKKEIPPVTTPEEQKAQLEKTALAVMDEFAAANFEDVCNLGTYLYEEYSEDNYDYSEVEDWADECYEALSRTFTGQVVEGSVDWGWMDILDSYTVICKASDFTGKFEAKNGRWKYTAADDLSFHVKDMDGNPCVLRLTTSGKTKKVYVDNDYSYDWENCYYDEENGVWVYLGEVDKIYFHVPENIQLTLTQNNKNLASVVFKADLSSIKGEEFNLGTDKVNLSATAEFNGYSVVVDKFKYAPEKGTAASATIKKGSKTLISAAASADIDATNEEFYGSENNKVEVDIMGEVQIKGSVQRDVIDVAEKLEDAYDNDMDEGEFKKGIARINEMIDLNVYYNKSKTSSAKVELRAFSYASYNESDYGYVERWDIEPVIVFNDGTSYGFEEFFNEDDFKKVIKAFERLFEDFYDMLEDVIEDDDYYDDDDYNEDYEY